MFKPESYLLMNQATNHLIAVGDRIEVLEAYGRKDYNSAFVYAFQVNGRNFRHLLPKIYIRNLERVARVGGEITRLERDGMDLLITVQSGPGIEH